MTSCWGGNKFLLWCRISSEIELYSVFQCFLFVTRNLTGSFTRFSGLAKLHTSCIKFACFRFFSNLEVTMTYFNERVPSEKNTLDLNGDVHLAHQSPFQNRQRPSLSLPNPLLAPATQATKFLKPANFNRCHIGRTQERYSNNSCYRPKYMSDKIKELHCVVHSDVSNLRRRRKQEMITVMAVEDGRR